MAMREKMEEKREVSGEKKTLCFFCFLFFCFLFFLHKAREAAKSGLVLFHEAMQMFDVWDFEGRYSPVLKDCSERNERRIHRTLIVLILLSYCSRVGLDNVDAWVGENVERWMC
jgi:hypothetical protein